MANEQLQSYINKQLQAGVSQEVIKNKLLSSGWPNHDIDTVFNLQETGVFKGGLELLSSSFNIYRQRFWTLVGINFLWILISSVVALTIGGVSFFFLRPESRTFSNIYLILLFAIPLSILTFIIQQWGQLALLQAIKFHQEKIGIIQSYKRGWGKMISYWWLTFLAGIVGLGGFLLFFIPGIIFAVWFSLAIYILIDEDIGGLDALLKSKYYVKGRWWGVLRRFALFGFFSLLLFIPLFLITMLKIKILETILSILMTLLWMPFTLIYGYELYRNLHSLKQSDDYKATRGSKVILIIVSVLGLLLPVILLGVFLFLSINVKPSSQIEKANDARRSSDQLQIQQSLDLYYSDNNAFPDRLENLSPKYMKTIPSDPSNKPPYSYKREQDGKNYQLCIEFKKSGRKCVSADLGSKHIRSDAVVPPDALENVKFIVDFNDGKMYEHSPAYIINPAEKTIAGYFKTYGFGYQLDIEMNFPMHPSDIILFDSDNELKAIGTYENTQSRKWKCYLNGQYVSLSSSTSLKNYDQVLCKYESV